MAELIKELQLNYKVFYPNTAYDNKALAIMLTPLQNSYLHNAIYYLIKSRSHD